MATLCLLFTEYNNAAVSCLQYCSGTDSRRLLQSDWQTAVSLCACVFPSQGSDDESYVSDVSDNISEDNASVTDNVSRQSRSISGTIVNLSQASKFLFIETNVIKEGTPVNQPCFLYNTHTHCNMSLWLLLDFRKATCVIWTNSISWWWEHCRHL